MYFLTSNLLLSTIIYFIDHEIQYLVIYLNELYFCLRWLNNSRLFHCDYFSKNGVITSHSKINVVM